MIKCLCQHIRPVSCVFLLCLLLSLCNVERMPKLRHVERSDTVSPYKVVNVHTCIHVHSSYIEYLLHVHVCMYVHTCVCMLINTVDISCQGVLCITQTCGDIIC